MIRVLFVDDEPRVLDGLRRMLRKQRHEWEMVFAEGGEAALAEFEKQPFDVVVTDMKMPGIDGAELLRRVHKRWPETVRVVLSGHTELEAALRTVPIAHQFLTKPCEADRLREVVRRACALSELLADEQLRRSVGQINSLPSLPTTYFELTRVLASPDTEFADVARVVERDVSMAAKVLQVVNSGFFGLPRRVTRIETAVSFLGVNMIKNLVLSAEVFRPFGGKDAPPGFSWEDEERHAVRTGTLARELFTDKHMKDDAFIAGMLHDIGKLILASELPERLRQAHEVMREKAIPLHRAEEELDRASHATLGGYLLGLWGLPYPVVEAVAHHHTPSRVETSRFDLLGAVHVADVLVREQDGGEGLLREGPLDELYLERLGVADRIPEWRERARELAERERDAASAGGP